MTTETRSGPARSLTVSASRIGSLLARILVITSLLPYAAVPLGSSTNLPLSSIIAVGLLLTLWRNGALMFVTAGMLAVPAVSAVVRLFFDTEPPMASGIATWFFYVLPLPSMAAAMVVLRGRAVPWLSWGLIGSCVIALIQKFVYLNHGVVPWLWAYDLPGYASVRDLAPVIAEYVRRPFGLFPESSFMVGTLTMAVMGMIMAERRFNGKLHRISLAAAILACATIAVSGSGSSLVGLFVIAASASWPLIRSNALAAIVVVPAGLGAALYLGLASLLNRSDSFNWSWADRTASIVGSARLLLSEPTIFLLGIGRGEATIYFSQNRVPLSGLPHYNPLTDVFSVLARITLEFGVLLALPVLVFMAWNIVVGAGKGRTLLGWGALLCWLTAAGIAVSYDSAFWIFGLPGLALGLRLAVRESATGSFGIPQRRRTP